MDDRIIPLLLTIAPLCAFAFTGALLEGARLYRLNRRPKS